MIFSKYKAVLFLVLIASVWVFILNYFLQIFSQDYVYPDTESYIRASEELYFFFKPDEIRPSLIAAFTGLPLLFNFSTAILFDWNVFLNLVIWFSTIILVFKISAKIVTKKRAFLMAVAYILSVGSLLIVFEFLAETIFTFFIMLTIFFFQRYEISQKISCLIIALSVLACSTLIKPVTLGLFILAVIYYGYVNFIKIIYSKWSSLLYLSLLILFTHMYAMKKTYGNFTVTYIDTYTYYNYLGTRADCLKKNVAFVQCNNYRYRYFNSLSRPEGKKEALNDMKNQLSTNTINFIKAYFINLKYNSNVGSGYFYAYTNKNKDGNFEHYKVIFRGISRLQNIFYTIIGLVLAVFFLFKSKLKYIREVAFAVLYIILMSAISSDQADRFHIVVYPLILILIAAFFSKKKLNCSLNNLKNISVFTF